MILPQETGALGGLELKPGSQCQDTQLAVSDGILQEEVTCRNPMRLMF